MLKLIAQCVVLAALIGLARAMSLGIPVSIGLVLLGVFAVHFIFDRFFGYRPGNPVAIRDDDPLLLEALQLARKYWPEFLALHATRPQNCVVKFKLNTSHGIENVWAELLSMSDADATVRIVTPPKGTTDSDGQSERTVPTSEIVDWQVVFDDESLCGGFTQQAVFRIIERDSGELPEQYANVYMSMRNHSISTHKHHENSMTSKSCLHSGTL